MISDGQCDSVFGLGFGRLQGGFSADVVDTFQSISDDRVGIVAFGKKIAHFVGFGREIGVVTAKSTKPSVCSTNMSIQSQQHALLNTLHNHHWHAIFL